MPPDKVMDKEFAQGSQKVSNFTQRGHFCDQPGHFLYLPLSQVAYLPNSS